MHFFGVLIQVHFEAKRNGLRGLRPDEMPDLKEALKRDWPTVIPLIVLLGIIVPGYTPYLAAFWRITLCIAVGLLTPRNRLPIGDISARPLDARTDSLARRAEEECGRTCDYR